MILFAAVFALSSGTTDLYVGTYTSPAGSRGIYRVVLKVQTGALSQPELVAEAQNPSYLALSPSGSELFAVDESDQGSVSGYRIRTTGAMEPINRRPVPGAAPCFLSVDPSGRNVLVASYGVGFISSLQILADGSLTPVTCRVQSYGSGPNKGRQEQSHMHWVATDRRDQFLYSCDLGADRVRCDRFDPSTGAFTPGAGVDAESLPGSGPRHGAFGPGGRFLYVDNEMADSVSVFEVDRRTGGLELKQTVSALAAGEAKPGSTAAEITCHPSGRWLYVSIRGADNVAVFTIQSDGWLKLMQIKPLSVRTPRGFAIDPSGRWLVVAGQSSNDLVALPIDAKTGALGASGDKVSIDAPVCVVFWRR